MSTKSIYTKYLPYFQDRYSFEICSKDRIIDVMDFINQYWKKDHILAKSLDFMNWQYYNNENDNYNFIIAVYKKTDEIHSIYGYTLSSHFDYTIKMPVKWGNIWKNREDIGEPGLGMMVCWKTFDLYNEIVHIGLGLSTNAINLSIKYGTVGIVDQYFIIHPTKNNFSIVDNVDDYNRNILNIKYAHKTFKKCCLDEFINVINPIKQYIPSYKSVLYYINRFFLHPVYEYKLNIIIATDKSIIGAFFWRFCFYKDTKCIRIVDYFGKNRALESCHANFNDMLIEYDAEYIDFLCVNMPVDEMVAAGFHNRKNYSRIIIPNYFEPFIRNNIDIYYTIVNNNILNRIYIFKADSDQDRPN